MLYSQKKHFRSSSQRPGLESILTQFERSREPSGVYLQTRVKKIKIQFNLTPVLIVFCALQAIGLRRYEYFLSLGGGLCV